MSERFACVVRPRELGFTLVELMVAVLISLFLVLGLSALYMNMKTSFNSQDKLGQLQDTERVAATILNKTVQSAGYFPIVLDASGNGTTTNPFPGSTVANADGTSTVFGAAQSITGTSGAGAGASDTVDVRYQTASGDGLMGCLGNTNTSGTQQIFVNHFAVDANHNLTCAVDGGTPTVLVGGVNQMTVLYGADTDGDGIADTYLSAAQVTSAGLWAAVYTAQISLQFLNPLVAANAPATPLPTTWVQTISLKNAS